MNYSSENARKEPENDKQSRMLSASIEQIKKVRYFKFISSLADASFVRLEIVEPK